MLLTATLLVSFDFCRTFGHFFLFLTGRFFFLLFRSFFVFRFLIFFCTVFPLLVFCIFCFCRPFFHRFSFGFLFCRSNFFFTT
ncbi:hypothetical protein SEEA0100_14100 [Salmonella enterica subsp. enterica serovar Anatum str. USDA 100]|nr:hypothetical protein SEEA0100_14100 [Salmonella enterica subsp. enterica serovar Anatum str. USDA 100]